MSKSMRQNMEELKEEILVSLQREAKRTSDLVAHLTPRFTTHQIENALSDLLDMGKITYGSDACQEVRTTKVLKRA